MKIKWTVYGACVCVLCVRVYGKLLDENFQLNELLLGRIVGRIDTSE